MLLISSILEEFPGVLPSQIEGEAFIPLLRIVETRRYAQAVNADEAHAAAVRSGAAKSGDAPSGPMIDLMYEIQGERIRLAEEHGNNG